MHANGGVTHLEILSLMRPISGSFNATESDCAVIYAIENNKKELL